MNRMLAAIVLIAGAAMLQGCAYDPYSGTYVPSTGYGYGYGGYSSYGTYGYPAYGYPSYGYPTYQPYYGGSAAIGGVWGGGYRGGDWDHRYHEEHEEHERREGGYRPAHPQDGHPINLGTNYHPPHPAGGYHPLPPQGGHPDHDHDHDQDHH